MVTNLPLLLAEEGSQSTTAGGRRVSNHQNWREKGVKSRKLAGEGCQMIQFDPPKSGGCSPKKKKKNSRYTKIGKLALVFFFGF